MINAPRGIRSQTVKMQSIPGLAEKLATVADWCREHAATLEGEERAAWERLAAFLDLMAYNMPGRS